MPPGEQSQNLAKSPTYKSYIINLIYQVLKMKFLTNFAQTCTVPLNQFTEQLNKINTELYGN